MKDITLWIVRGSNDEFNLYDVYGPTMFSLQVFHGGKFVKNPVTSYVHGKMNYVDMIDVDEFSITELNDMFKMLGYPDDEIVYYHYKIPGKELDNGLRALGTDQDVINMCEYVERVKVIEVYVEHGITRLNTHYDPRATKIQAALEWINENQDGNEVDIELCDGNEVNIQASDNNEYEDDVEDGNEVDVEDEYEDDVQDGDYIVDEDNEVEDVVVEMDKFKSVVEHGIDGCEGFEGYEDDIEVDMDDFDSPDDENDPPLQKAMKKLRKNKKAVTEVNVPFYVCQKFNDKEEIKLLVKSHALETRRQLVVRNNDNLRYRVVCHGINPEFSSGIGQSGKNKKKGGPQNIGESSTDDPLNKVGGSKSLKSIPKKRYPKPTCPWLLHVSRSRITDSWCVKTFIDKHNCLQTRKVRLYTVSTIAREAEEIIEVNPTIPDKSLQEMLQKKHQVEISIQKAARAKIMAKEKMEGDYRSQYAILREYCDELFRSNPGTTIRIDVEREFNPMSSTRQFKRIYICLGALKAGFKMSGREILGLDGCFMKGPFPGQVLTAVGIDANNGIYPVAYSIVEAKTTSSWTWFLECLGQDLDIYANSNFTFISDRQKGLLPAISNVFPNAEHRFCLRHIQENMKCNWRGNLFKEMLWKCASATTIPQFNKKMEDMKKENISLYEWLKNIPPKSWTRSHFSGRAKTDVLINNICEVFNRQLVGGRDKPIITCLEFIREYLMKRIVVVQKIISKSDGPLTPCATKTFNFIKSQASQYSVIMAAANKFQVSGPWMDQCSVDVEKRTCSCRKWELTGMPCKHAVAAIWNMSQNSIHVGILEKWVDEVYRLDTWKKVYMNTINPINGREFWSPSTIPTTITPPKHHKQVGRPKKKRKKSAVELLEITNRGKLSRKGGTTTCGKCKLSGHNSRSCTGAPQISQNK